MARKCQPLPLFSYLLAFQPRQPSREFSVDALKVKEIRQATGLSQAKFAAVIDVQLGTLRNWEQGRREHTGPAKALLRAIHNDPKHVLRNRPVIPS